MSKGMPNQSKGIQNQTRHVEADENQPSTAAKLPRSMTASVPTLVVWTRQQKANHGGARWIFLGLVFWSVVVCARVPDLQLEGKRQWSCTKTPLK